MSSVLDWVLVLRLRAVCVPRCAARCGLNWGFVQVIRVYVGKLGVVVCTKWWVSGLCAWMKYLLRMMGLEGVLQIRWGYG